MKIPSLKKSKEIKSQNKQHKETQFSQKLKSIKTKLGFEEKIDTGETKRKGLMVKFPGGSGKWVPLGAWQYNKQYSDSLGPHFTLIVDEAAELLQVEGGRSAEAKEQAAFRDEIETALKSITQLGRSSGVAAVIATQRNDASVIPGVIQNNCLALDTKIKVLRPVNIDINKDYDKVYDRSRMKRLADKFGVDYNEDGIVFKDQNDKNQFYENMKKDAELFDKTSDEENKSKSMLKQLLDSKQSVQISR